MKMKSKEFVIILSVVFYLLGLISITLSSTAMVNRIVELGKVSAHLEYSKEVAKHSDVISIDEIMDTMNDYEKSIIKAYNENDMDYLNNALNDIIKGIDVVWMFLVIPFALFGLAWFINLKLMKDIIEYEVQTRLEEQNFEQVVDENKLK